MKVGLPVVHLYGNDNGIYRIQKIYDTEQCDLVSYTGRTKSKVHITQIREASDVELLIGYRHK